MKTTDLALSAALLLACTACDDGGGDAPLTDAAADATAGDMGLAEDAAPQDGDLPDAAVDMGAPLPAPFAAADLVGTWTSVDCEPTLGEFLTRQFTLTADGDYQVFGAVFDDEQCTIVMSDFVQVGTFEITGGSPLGEDVAHVTFRMAHHYWTVRQAYLLPGFDINMCGTGEPWAVNVTQDIAATGCLGFAYPIGECPDGEQEVLRLDGDRIWTGERPLDICAERAPAVSDLPLARMGDAVEIDAPQFYPEGVAIDAARSLYVGSYTTGEIRKAAFAEASAETLVAPGALGGAALGLKIHDDALWACVTDLANPDASALVRLDPSSGEETGRYPLPGGGICNDLTFDENSTAYVTESSRNEVMRLAAGGDTLETWFTGEALPPVGGLGFGFNGLVIADDGSVLVGRVDDGTLTRIPVLENGDAGEAVIETVEPAAVTFGIDGMQRWRGGYYAVRDSQVVRLLPGDPWTVEVIAAGDDFPTTLAIGRNGNAWTVESKFGLLFDGDDSTDAAPPFRVLRHPLR